MKKMFLLIIGLFLFTGCKVDYNIMINEDLSMLESVNMTGTDEFFSIYNKSSKLNVINMMMDEDRRDILSDNEYKYEIVNADTPYVKAEKKYNNINDFCNNTVFYEQYFDNVICNNSNGTISLKTIGFKPNEPDDPSRYDIAMLAINVKSNYSFENSNASEFDKKSNTYTWYIGADTTDFSMEFSIDTNKVFVKENENNELMILLIIGGIVVISWIVIIIMQKNKKSSNQ